MLAAKEPPIVKHIPRRIRTARRRCFRQRILATIRRTVGATHDVVLRAGTCQRRGAARVESVEARCAAVDFEASRTCLAADGEAGCDQGG
jgi:hypothetical protein